MSEIQDLIVQGKFSEAIDILEKIENKNYETQIQLGELYIATNESSKAKSILEGIISLNDDGHHGIWVAKALVVLASSSLRDGSFESGLSLLDSKKDLFSFLNPEDTDARKVKISYHNVKATLNGQIGKLDEVISNANLAVELLKDTNDYATLSRITYNFGVIFTRNNELELAINYLENSKNAATHSGNKMMLGYVTMELGAIYQSIGEIEKGVDCFETQYEIFQELGSDEHKAWAYSDLGNGRRGIGLLSESQKLLDLGLQLYEKGEDKRTYANHLTYMALNHYIQGDLQLSITYDKKAIDLYTEIDELSMIINPQFLVAESYIAKGEFSNAINIINSIDYNSLSDAQKLRFLHCQTKLQLSNEQHRFEISERLNKLELPLIQKNFHHRKQLIEISQTYLNKKSLSIDQIEKIRREADDFQIFQEVMLWSILSTLIDAQYDDLWELVHQYRILLNNTASQPMRLKYLILEYVLSLSLKNYDNADLRAEILNLDLNEKNIHKLIGSKTINDHQLYDLDYLKILITKLIVLC